tara:strand:+ start:11792 stop:12661 length:870 start_codon:yes stop_codon:yes gene_type:complete
MIVRIGSLFAGIGGFELGIEAAIEGAETIWQVERDPFCQKVLKKHWPNSRIYNDVRDITLHNVEPVDMIIGGFPCQDISAANSGGRGLNGEKSGLWWEMHRIISELRPKLAIMENVPNILIRGGLEVVGSLAEIGYDCEWSIISARDFGAPHLRRRWFCIAYPSDSDGISRVGEDGFGIINSAIVEGGEILERRSSSKITDSDGSSLKRIRVSVGMEEKRGFSPCGFPQGKGTHKENYWEGIPAPSALCRVDDGIPNRIHRLRALGNAIVPQCSEYIGRLILESGLLHE